MVFTSQSLLPCAVNKPRQKLDFFPIVNKFFISATASTPVLIVKSTDPFHPSSFGLEKCRLGLLRPWLTCYTHYPFRITEIRTRCSHVSAVSGFPSLVSSLGLTVLCWLNHSPYSLSFFDLPVSFFFIL